ncbi:MAG: hypothetical protein EON54_11290 [Alcaligenaceae bacterium]|nr:MAG: hypothetical protein EON54_11290 [Alcaligenaceae bacterium]
MQAEEVQAKLHKYGKTAADLNRKATRGPRAKSDDTRIASAHAQATVKYRNPTGGTGSGGRGRKPEWVADV